MFGPSYLMARNNAGICQDRLGGLFTPFHWRRRLSRRILIDCGVGSVEVVVRWCLITLVPEHPHSLLQVQEVGEVDENNQNKIDESAAHNNHLPTKHSPAPTTRTIN